jgi:5'-3' exonuclease
MFEDSLLILDCNYLCRRAQHSTGPVLVNGVLFGFFRGLLKLQQDYTDVAFCFDSHAHNKRKDLFPGYKANREARYRGLSADADRLESEYRRQLAELPRLLVGLGHRNVFHYDGYEADDLVASVCREWEGFKMIVASDKDFYQLLDEQTAILNPTTHKVFTHAWFRRRYGIEPRDWVEVKAMAGCKTDNVPGVVGIGELSACRYIRGDLRDHRKETAIEGAEDVLRMSRRLVRLPYPGTPRCALRADRCTAAKWNNTMGSLGLRSLIGARRDRVRRV